MHSIRRERRRLVAGMLCLVLMLLWKQSHTECHNRDAAQGAEYSTCSHGDEEEQTVEVE